MENKDIVEQFAQFTAADWINWIDAYIYGNKMSPALHLGDAELDSRLIWVLNKFKEKQIPVTELGAGVVAAMKLLAQAKGSPRYLFQLIEYIGLLTPERHSVELELFFKSDLLAQVVYEDLPLQAVLLSALLNFVTIGDYTEYFYARLDDDREGLLVMQGLKYFYMKKPLEDYFAYLEALIKKGERMGEEKAGMIGVSIVFNFIEMSYYRENYRDLYDWLAKNIYRHKDSVVGRAMLDQLHTWLNPQNKIIEDYYWALLLKGLVDAYCEPSDKAVAAFIEGVELQKEKGRPMEYSDTVKVFSEFLKDPDFDPYKAYFKLNGKPKKKNPEDAQRFYKFNEWANAGALRAGVDL